MIRGIDGNLSGKLQAHIAVETNPQFPSPEPISTQMALKTNLKNDPYLALFYLMSPQPGSQLTQCAMIGATPRFSRLA